MTRSCGASVEIFWNERKKLKASLPHGILCSVQSVWHWCLLMTETRSGREACAAWRGAVARAAVSLGYNAGSLHSGAGRQSGYRKRIKMCTLRLTCCAHSSAWEKNSRALQGLLCRSEEERRKSNANSNVANLQEKKVIFPGCAYGEIFQWTIA